ncbi:MAG: tRNA pseudouridine(38-40) synthase TruA [Proteobacteria bacterium]|nr:tRNA pseudouridine(38-40) synthase TruA [Pseudomonadota bacterium]
MRNLKLVLAFDGTDYAGWQRQKDIPTIQGTLEDCIRIMTSEGNVVHGAGRTDAGVHALGMVANFHTGSVIPAQGFYRGLNSLLPDDIRILKALEVPEDFHSRYSAVGKVYQYRIFSGPVLLPTDRLYCVNVHWNLNIKAMAECLKILVGQHDFSSFEATGSRDVDKKCGRGAVREIFSADFKPEDKLHFFYFEFAGDGFLRHMIRNIVGTVLEVGIGKRTVESFISVLKKQDRTFAGPTAPAKGLFLKEVLYGN